MMRVMMERDRELRKRITSGKVEPKEESSESNELRR
jgi:hypothetical protein